MGCSQGVVVAAPGAEYVLRMKVAGTAVQRIVQVDVELKPLVAHSEQLAPPKIELTQPIAKQRERLEDVDRSRGGAQRTPETARRLRS